MPLAILLVVFLARCAARVPETEQDGNWAWIRHGDEALDSDERRAMRRITNPLVDFSGVPGLSLISEIPAPLKVMEHTNQAECARACNHDDQCKAFQHNRVEETCQLLPSRLEYEQHAGYYERKLSNSEVAAEERTRYALKVDEEVQRLTDILAAQTSTSHEQMEALDAKEMDIKVQKMDMDGKLKNLEAKLLLDPLDMQARDERVVLEQKLAEYQVILSSIEGDRSMQILELKRSGERLAKAHRKQLEARKDASMAVTNFQIEESMRLLNSTHEELEAIRRHRKQRIKTMANLDPGPAGTTDQELDDTGFITGFIDGVKLEVVTARGTNAEAKVRLVGNRGSTLMLPLHTEPLISMSTTKLKIDSGPIGGIKQVHLHLTGSESEVWIPCTLQLTGDGGNTRKVFVEQAVSGGHSISVDVSVAVTNVTQKGASPFETDDCEGPRQMGCTHCVSSRGSDCTKCKPEYFLSNVRRSCDGSGMLGECVPWPQLGHPAITRCTPGFESDQPATKNEESICTKGASEWSFYKVNEMSHNLTSSPKRVLAQNVRLYKKVSCSSGACSSNKNGNCHLLCYMTSIKAFQKPEVQAKMRRTGQSVCPWTDREDPLGCMDADPDACVAGGVITSVTTGFWAGEACCFRECRVPEAAELVVPGIKEFVIPAGLPSSWSEKPLSIF